MKFRKLTEALEDEFDLLLAAGDYKCKLTQYDIEEAYDYEMLLDDIKTIYSILVSEFGDKLKRWSYYEDDNVDFGYKVILTDGTKHIVEINKEHVDIVNESLIEEVDTKFIIVAVTKEGTRLFYNSIDDNFVTSAEAATIYDEHDVAIDDWHRIDKTQFKRVFVPNYDPELFEAVIRAVKEDPDDEDIKRNHGYRQDNLKDGFDVGDRVAHRWADLFNVGTIKGIRENEGVQYQVEWDYSDSDYVEWLYGDEITHWVDVNESLTDSETCCICNKHIVGYGNNAEPVCSGRCCDRCNIEKVIPARLEMLNNSEDDYETDYRYYVYANEDDVVGDEFEYDEDAILWAKENGYPIVKIHNYYRDERGKLQPDGYPEIIWTAD